MGRDLLFAVHGFNVSREAGLRKLGALNEYLDLPSPALLIGVLWPGDCWLPFVDYPFEGEVALDCGRRLALFCNEQCVRAGSLSFVSHSLGARLVLEAVSGLRGNARSVCLTAAAVNRDCLTTQYSAAASKCKRIAVLASQRDRVLELAFSIGDPFADLLHDDHAPFQIALGRSGPLCPAPASVGAPVLIPDALDYGHNDYLPGDEPGQPQDPAALWRAAADFMKRAFLGQPQPWPNQNLS